MHNRFTKWLVLGKNRHIFLPFLSLFKGNKLIVMCLSDLQYMAAKQEYYTAFRIIIINMVLIGDLIFGFSPTNLLSSKMELQFFHISVDNKKYAFIY